MITAMDDVAIPSWVERLPKADMHCHAEAYARLDQLRARGTGCAAHDWRAGVAAVMALPAGLDRLFALDRQLDREALLRLNESRDTVVARLSLLMEESAATGAILVEVRLGQEILLVPDFMDVFREATARCAARSPSLHTTAVVSINLRDMERSEQRVEACIRSARHGLHGIDFLPYTGVLEADYAAITRWASQASDAGLGVTIHAGEFSTDGMELAARIPHVSRIGHGTFIPRLPRLLDYVAERGIVMECCLTSNVLLGAVESYEAHPVGDLIAGGVRVTLATDNPAKLCTNIGREYAIAAALGFSEDDLLMFTRIGVASSFLPEHEKRQLLSSVAPLE